MSRLTIFKCDRCGKAFDPPPIDTDVDDIADYADIARQADRERAGLGAEVQALNIRVKISGALTAALGAAKGPQSDAMNHAGAVIRSFDDLCPKCEQAVSGYLARIFKVTLTDAEPEPTEEEEEEEPNDGDGDGELGLASTWTDANGVPTVPGLNAMFDAFDAGLDAGA
jgi:hypothetical protein